MHNSPEYLEHSKHIAMHIVLRNISSRFSRNTKADSSKLLENLEEMFLCY